MAYSMGIEYEFAYVKQLGPDPVEGEFHPDYHGILNQWFSTSLGYLIAPRCNKDMPDFTVFRRRDPNNGFQEIPLLIVELKRPGKYTPSGKLEAVEQLKDYIIRRLHLTHHDAIYGLIGIGLHWAVYKMKKEDPGRLITMVSWQDDISDAHSFEIFRDEVARLVYDLE